MSKENIVNRIVEDAQKEAETIVAAAEKRASEILFVAEEKAQKERRETEKEVAEKIKEIEERKQATARLDGAKILLAAKRSVIDGVYAQALERLVSLGKEDTLSLSAALLSGYADEGDTVLLAENYPFAKELSILPVVKSKKLQISDTRVRIDGGFLLIGKQTDKNLSYGAILAMDREENQSKIAEKLFKEV